MKKILCFLVGVMVAGMMWGQSASATGNLVNTNDNLQIQAMGTIGVGISGTFTMTLNFEGSIDGTNWFSVQALNSTSGAAVTTTSATGIFQVSGGGFRWVRVRANPVSSGTASINMYSLLNAKGPGGGGGGGGGPTSPGGANTQVQYNSSGSFAGSASLAWVSPVLTIGSVGGGTGGLNLAGTTSGVVSILPQAAAGTFNFNLPITAGSANQPLLSGGGGSTPMLWGSRSGSTTTFGTTSGSLTSGNCVKFDASGNLVDAGSACATTTGFIKADGSVTWTGDDNHGGHNLTNVDTAQFVSLQFSATGVIDTPPAGYGSYGVRYQGQGSAVPLDFPWYKNTLGNQIPLQTALWDFRTSGYWLPSTGTNGGGLGLLAGSQGASGTLSDVAWASTNLYTRTHHQLYTCGTGTNNRCGLEGTTNGTQFWRGNAANLGGWIAVIPVGLHYWSTGNPAFSGLVNQVAAWVAVTTSSLTTECNTTHKQFVGIGKDPGDTNYSLVSCDGTNNISKATITGIQDCTTPANCANGGLFVYLYLMALPNDTKIYYQIDNWAVQPPVTLISGSLDCTVASKCPAATTALAYYNQVGTGTNSGANAAGMDLFPQYIMSLSQ